MDDLIWLKATHDHQWHLGPMTDFLMRQRQAVCVGCWELRTLRAQEWDGLPEWNADLYEQYKDEVEKRFFGG